MLFQHTMHVCTSATSILFCLSAWVFLSNLTNSKLLSFSSNDIYDWFNLTMLHISSMSCSLKRTFESIIYWKATRAYRICWEGINIWILQMKILRLKVGREPYGLSKQWRRDSNIVLTLFYPWCLFQQPPSLGWLFLRLNFSYFSQSCSWQS